MQSHGQMVTRVSAEVNRKDRLLAELLTRNIVFDFGAGSEKGVRRVHGAESGAADWRRPPAGGAGQAGGKQE